MELLKKRFRYKPIKKYNGLEGKIPVANKSTLLGIEIELEQVDIMYFPQTWQTHNDDSLKLNGIEFVSIPIEFKYLEVELNRLYQGLFKSNISVRCSLHVHLNVQDMTLEQLENLLILYLIFEKSLFRVSGNRWKNIFCTPLFLYPDIVSHFFDDPFQRWNKYLALNLLPIWGDVKENSKKYGTIEFRHHTGSTKVEDIILWCNLIVSLKNKALSVSQEELYELVRTMNTSSSYYGLAHDTFSDWDKVILDSPLFKEEAESCISKVKYILGDLLKPSLDSDFNTVKGDF